MPRKPSKPIRTRSVEVTNPTSSHLPKTKPSTFATTPDTPGPIRPWTATPGQQDASIRRARTSTGKGTPRA